MERRYAGFFISWGRIALINVMHMRCLSCAHQRILQVYHALSDYFEFSMLCVMIGLAILTMLYVLDFSYWDSHSKSDGCPWNTFDKD